MKLLLVVLLALAPTLVACGSDDDTCSGDNCVCTDDCEHTCSDGAATCHIQGAPGKDVDVTCTNNADCHVECSSSSSCRVDCGGSDDCNVTCPGTSCTVTNCVDCDVTCGLTGAIATKTGTTATCP
jgi:hypothetical protein